MATDPPRIDAVVFDLDGVLVQSEHLWDEARRELVAEEGLEWPDGATQAMMGMSSPEWSAYVRDEIGVRRSAGDINAEVVERLRAHYREQIPWLPGAQDAVRRLAERWPLGLATSSNREVIEEVLDAGLRDLFQVTVSSEEVARGKPSPDVYEEALRRLGTEPGHSAAIEDSTNGLLAADAAGMAVVAVPNDAHPPERRALERAGVVLDSLDDLTPEAVERAAGRKPS
jgi:HAD superfamily hydrolase (TIGR01509 family)